MLFRLGLAVWVFAVVFCANRANVDMLSVDFEVFGRVQGVFFRKYTQQQAKALGLKGYCMNTEKGTVQGQMQGPKEKIDQMKEWLQKVGSPSSKIDKALFANEKPINDYSSDSFVIKR